MRDNQIVDMARQAGAWPELSETPEKDVAFLRRFAEIVLAEEIQCVRVLCEVLVGCEREACAQVCEELGMATNGMNERNHECAAAIRARGQA